MMISDFVESDYYILADWWEKRGWSPVPYGLLPKGFMVHIGDTPICAGFIYEDKNVPFAMMEWIISNPAVKSTDAVRSLKELMNMITAYADEKGLSLHTSCKVPSLIKLYERFGFENADTEMTNMVRVPRWE